MWKTDDTDVWVCGNCNHIIREQGGRKMKQLKDKIVYDDNGSAMFFVSDVSYATEGLLFLSAKG